MPPPFEVKMCSVSGNYRESGNPARSPRLVRLMLEADPLRDILRGSAGAPGQAEEGRELAPSLIIVSRDRPELFDEFRERYGNVCKVILDRRREPRSAIPSPPRQAASRIVQRDGFLIVLPR